MSIAAGARAEPWSPEELVERLRGLGARYHHLHPFHVRMDAGELSREELQRWVANRFYYQRCIPIKDAAILSNCPEVAVRRLWIQRIIDHDGTSPGAGGIESWLRLGDALGVDRDELESERRVLPGVRYAVDAYVDFARRKPWIDRAGLTYFRDRLEQAPRDADYALGLVVERCVTREQQERAVAALRFKTEVLWAQLDAIERGDTQPAESAA